MYNTAMNLENVETIHIRHDAAEPKVIELKKKWDPLINTWPHTYYDFILNMMHTAQFCRLLAQLYWQNGLDELAVPAEEEARQTAALIDDLYSKSGQKMYRYLLDKQRGHHNAMAIFSSTFNQKRLTKNQRGELIAKFSWQMGTRDWYCQATDLVAAMKGIRHQPFGSTEEAYRTQSAQILQTGKLPEVLPYVRKGKKVLKKTTE